MPLTSQEPFHEDMAQHGRAPQRRCPSCAVAAAAQRSRHARPAPRFGRRSANHVGEVAQWNRLAAGLEALLHAGGLQGIEAGQVAEVEVGAVLDLADLEPENVVLADLEALRRLAAAPRAPGQASAIHLCLGMERDRRAQRRSSAEAGASGDGEAASRSGLARRGLIPPAGACAIASSAAELSHPHRNGEPADSQELVRHSFRR